ncbi:MAG: MATE family efflux transporter [Clostridia bacterium]|nr:MATE family efflux transporter [Clostridia bacterium]
MEKEENILGYEKIGKLIKKFSIPCIISLLVNSLYNIVDQIFIGWGVGYIGNGATNVVFPITMLCLAFALMFGDGSSAYLSLKLGEKNKKEASKGVLNGILISVIVAVLLCAIIIGFLPQILNLFGCTEALRNDAMGYGFFVALGLPFMMIGTTLNSIIRADGSPKYSMASMVTGAILNIILDPIFIFVFKMGVEGAAIATTISQFVTFAMNVAYLRRLKTIKISKKDIRLKPSVVLKVSMLGISSFITQMSIVLVIAFENNLLGKYGAESEFGSEIPITVLGIVMKISQILNSIIIGIAVGAQPILGYNYGAQNYDRVRKALKYVLGLSLIVSTIAFLLFQLIPDKLILIFGSGNELYIEFACYAFRTYLMLCICNGIQIPAGIFFQAIGKGVKSAVISLSRQILFLIPAMVIFGATFGIHGILYAGPLADGLAFVVASVLLILQVRKLKNVENSNKPLITNPLEITQPSSSNIVITLTREYGSGGRYIGKLVAQKLGIKLYDKEFIIEVAEKTGLSEQYIKENEQKRNALDILNNGYYSDLSNSDELFVKESQLIKEVSDREPCIIVGRCADQILKDNKNVLKVFIYSDMKNKIDRAVKYYGMDKKKAEKEIIRIDKLRENHYKYYTDKKWKDFSNYDICINSDKVGVEKAADLIVEMAKDLESISSQNVTEAITR